MFFCVDIIEWFQSISINMYIAVAAGVFCLAAIPLCQIKSVTFQAFILLSYIILLISLGIINVYYIFLISIVIIAYMVFTYSKTVEGEVSYEQ